MVKLFVKPAQGLVIRDPKTMQILPPEGKLVTESTYWVRRLKCGDVSIVKNESMENVKESKIAPKAVLKKVKNKEEQGE